MLDYLETIDLRGPQLVLGLVGALLSVYLMQLSWRSPGATAGNLVLSWIRRFTLAATALGNLWILSYGQARGWQPWPPSLMLCFSVDLLLAVRITEIRRRERLQRESRRLTP